MSDLPLKEFARLLAEKTGLNSEIASVEEAGSGHHATGYLLKMTDGRKYFVKKITTGLTGFEIPERKLKTLLVSHAMTERNDLETGSLGVLVQNADHLQWGPELVEGTTVYQFQKYLSLGQKYDEVLENKKDKLLMDDEDRAELEQIALLAAKIHQPYPGQDEDLRKRVYRAGLRSVITHPELTLGIIDSFEMDHEVFPAARRQEYIRKMYAVYDNLKEKPDRLRALHGDFSVLNLFKRANGEFDVIDYSRIPWGDPGIDIGWLFAEFWRRYLLTGNEYFKQMGEEFLNKYSAITGDQDLRQAICLSLGFLAIIYTTPLIWGKMDPQRMEKIFSAAEKILDNKVFSW